MTRLESLRVPPQSVDAEQAVLGGLMLAPHKLPEIALGEGDFYRRDHALIFRAMVELEQRGQPADAVTLGEWMEQTGSDDRIASYLVELASTTPSAANIHAYAKIIREKAVLRRLIEIATSAVNAGFDPDGRGAIEVVDATVRDLMALSKAETNHEGTLRGAIKEAFHELTVASETPGMLRGVTSGLARLDKRLGGFHPSDLIVIGARPAMGKTALLLNFAEAASAKGHTVGVISGEQPRLQVAQRHLSMHSSVAAERLRNGDIADEHWARLTAAVADLGSRNYLIYDRSAPTVDEVERIARKWKQQHGLKALYVDYIQRIRAKGCANRAEEVGEVGHRLKNVARDLDIPVIALAQVKREVETRVDKRPMAGDLANSDELTREADSVVMLYRDEVYHEDTTERGIAELNVEKNRHGPLGVIRAKWFAETMRFADLEEFA